MAESEIHLEENNEDSLPLQRICYMDPITRSPTNNDVVKETMVRTMNVATEIRQEYAVVTYDLAVALKAYSIQAIEAPTFDNLLIMLGNFHMDLAFFGAVGTYINDCGIEYMLSETGTLAEGSLQGFIKGKFYNRCTRLHEIVGNVMEKKLYDRFLETLATDEVENFQQAIAMVPDDPEEVELYLTDTTITEHLNVYERYFNKCLNGDFGETCQYWTIYIYLINRLYREVQRCVRMNDVSGYIAVLPMLLEIYFALNRPNYARWGSLFYEKLKNAHPQLRAILNNGVFSIRRTKKDYARTAVDLSLEQTVNRDAASQMKGIVAFRNSESAMKRWSVTVTQRAAAVTELRSLAGMEQGENAAKQLRHHRIVKDNQQMSVLSARIDETCNPFSDETVNAGGLLNIATGKAASPETSDYLLNILPRGKIARCQFEQEWKDRPGRFQEKVKRTRVQNFAAENIKRKNKLSSSQMAKKNAESLRDTFIRMLVIVAEKTALHLKNVLAYPITQYPLSLAHCDGTMMKTNKAQLLRKLETYQTDTLSYTELPNIDVEIVGGGHLIHSVLSQVSFGTTYSSIARVTLMRLCSSMANEVHLCLDRYDQDSIKECERKLRGSEDQPYVITGPEQCIRQGGKQLLKNGTFKNEFAQFLMKEWTSLHYGTILRNKFLVVSYGGKCLSYEYNEQDQTMTVSRPQHLQGNHEEADTLIAFHARNTTGNILVRASDTDVMVILIDALGRERPEVRATRIIIMDCGSGNSRRYINLSQITNCLEEKSPGLAAALPGCHAFTGCDYTSSFYRKGKVKAIDLLEKDGNDRFIEFFTELGEIQQPSIDVASDMVCQLYGQSSTTDVDEARFSKMLSMSGKINKEEPLSNIRKVDCALLPPSRRCLQKKLARAHYVTIMWSRATTGFPCDGISPLDYGWSKDNGTIIPKWFDGPAIPCDIFTEVNSTDGETEPDIMSSDEDDDQWSGDSDSEDESGSEST